MLLPTNPKQPLRVPRCQPRIAQSRQSLRRILPLSCSLVLILGSQKAIALPVESPRLISQIPSDSPQDIIIESPSEQLPPPPPAPTGSQPRFTCQFVNGDYTVMYHPQSQSGQGYPWAIPRFLGGGWTAQRRCQEISRRLEFYRPDGLEELRTSVENGYNTLCVTTQRIPNCRIVLTVPPGQDPEVTRDRVFQNLTLADGGQVTQGVNTFLGGGQGNQILNQLGQLINPNLPSLTRGIPDNNSAINLRPFLAPSDGGTGTQLRPSKSKPSQSYRLNPNKFR